MGRNNPDQAWHMLRCASVIADSLGSSQPWLSVQFTPRVQACARSCKPGQRLMLISICLCQTPVLTTQPHAQLHSSQDPAHDWSPWLHACTVHCLIGQIQSRQANPLKPLPMQQA